MVSSNNQAELGIWLCDKIGLVPTPDLQCIASVIQDKIKGVVGFDQYNGSSIVMHVAGEPGWITKDVLWAAFDYPFNVCKVSVILGFVPSGNADAIRFNQHLGFLVQTVIEGGHPDGSLIIMSMYREQCRFLKRSYYGNEDRKATRNASTNDGSRQVGGTPTH